MLRVVFVFITMMFAAFAADGPRKSGIDKSSIDPTCKPCDDFWRYANGTWVDKNPIPARYSRWGTMSVVNEANRERLRALLESAASGKAAPGTDERKIGDFYGSCVAVDAIDAAGRKPIDKDLDRVAAISSVDDLRKALVALQKETQASPLGMYAGPDLKDSNRIIANVGGRMLFLPERDYYFREDPRTKTIREEFGKHVTAMLQLAGDSPEAAAAGAKTVMDLETSFAQVMMTNVQRRDPYALYHKMDLAGLTELAPGIDWKSMFQMFAVVESTPVNVAEPEVLKTLEKQLSAFPLDGWKTWLRWRIVSNSAPYLSKAFRDENFRFRSTVLSGVKEQEPRWQICANTVDQQLGDALGRVFVEKHFPPEAKRRMNELVENLRATLREELDKADWLSAETRKNALAKLNAFTPKIGYPDRWRDYSKVNVGRADFAANVKASSLENRRYQLAKIGQPVDKNDWGMTPPTVNAYYSPQRNEIAFPAGILQPPMFDLEADDAMNYGAAAAVIGHEMGHGFDDQGSKFDAQGNLKNWWTDEDRKRFDERAGCIIDQFNTIEVGDGLKHNGKLVVGEALGDLGGLTLAYRAYKRSLGGKEGPVIDGLTADQRFFLSFARVWAGQDRPEAMRLRLNTDPHPLPKYRANGTLMNMPEFHKAFSCKAGDPMVRPAEKRCKLW